MQLSCPNMGCDVLGCGDIGYLKVIEKGKEKKKKKKMKKGNIYF
jgi:hypothetical protein